MDNQLYLEGPLKKTVNNLAVPNGKQWEPELAPACITTVLVSYTRNEFVKD